MSRAAECAALCSVQCWCQLNILDISSLLWDNIGHGLTCVKPRLGVIKILLLPIKFNAEINIFIFV